MQRAPSPWIWSLVAALALVLLHGALMTWASWVGAASTPPDIIRATLQEDETMVEWWHSNEAGGVVHVVVSLNDAGIDGNFDKFDEFVQRQQTRYPANTTAPNGDGGEGP